MLGRAKIGRSRWVAVMLVASVAFAIGCSGKSDSDGDDEDGDAGDGGTSGNGGTGFGGTTPFGGTAGSATGGTGAVDGACLNVCQRVQMCPDVMPVDCALDCRDLEDEAAALGCTTAYRNFIACWGSASDVCSLETSGCDAVITTYLECLNGTGGGSCMPGSVPENTSCSSLCARFDACPNATTTCAADCADEVADAAGAGCAAEYQAFVGCASTCANICVLTEDDCTAEVYDYLICFTDYCSANPNSTPCI